MRTVASRTLVPWIFPPAHDGAALIHLHRAKPAGRFPGLARLPEGWLEVAGSRVCSAQQRFAAYHRYGQPPAHYHCSNLAEDEPTAETVLARMTLRGWRVAVRPDRTGFQAGWQVGDTAHRLSGGPVELAGFMELVLGLTAEGD